MDGKDPRGSRGTQHDLIVSSLSSSDLRVSSKSETDLRVSSRSKPDLRVSSKSETDLRVSYAHATDLRGFRGVISENENLAPICVCYICIASTWSTGE